MYKSLLESWLSMSFDYKIITPSLFNLQQKYLAYVSGNPN